MCGGLTKTAPGNFLGNENFLDLDLGQNSWTEKWSSMHLVVCKWHQLKRTIVWREIYIYVLIFIAVTSMLLFSIIFSNRSMQFYSQSQPNFPQNFLDVKIWWSQHLGVHVHTRMRALPQPQAKYTFEVNGNTLNSKKLNLVSLHHDKIGRMPGIQGEKVHDYLKAHKNNSWKGRQRVGRRLASHAGAWGSPTVPDVGSRGRGTVEQRRELVDAH